jgi:hypothetical protein
MKLLKRAWLIFRQLKTWIQVVLILLLLSAIGALSGSSSLNTGQNTKDSSSINSSSTSQSVQRSYPVEYVRSAVNNPASLTVVFSVKNDGTQPVKPTCENRMQDSSGAYRGFDVFELTDNITPNQTKQIIVQLTITKEGAAYADQFSGECTASTSDTGTNAGNEVVISNIENFSAIDNSEGWYWGASFKANQQPMTQMDCVVKALNKSGNVIGTTSYRANTLNDGTVIGYGNDAQSFVDSTRTVVLSIKSFDVKCTL